VAHTIYKFKISKKHVFSQFAKTELINDKTSVSYTVKPSLNGTSI